MHLSLTICFLVMLLILSTIKTKKVRAQMDTNNESLEWEVGCYTKLMSLPAVKLLHITLQGSPPLC